MPEDSIAFVFLRMQIGKDREAMEDIKKLPGVSEAYSVYGVYDGIVKIEAPSMDKLKEYATKIRDVRYVSETMTQIVISPDKNQKTLNQ